MENYVGKIVKISGTDSWNRPFVTTGIVYAQREGIKGDSTVFSLIKTNGSVADTVAVMHDAQAKVTSTKIDPELRTALKEAYKNKVKFDAFVKKSTAEREVLDKQMKESFMCVKSISGEMTAGEFVQKVEDLFADKYPSTGGYYSKWFRLCSYSATEITMSQVQDVEKYANPEKFGFLYREYDNTIHISDASKEYKKFCERNAPVILPQLEKHCKTAVHASIGDKDWLTVERTYTFDIKYGYTQKSLDDIKQRIFGEPVKKASLASQVQAADSKRSSRDTVSKNKEEMSL